MAKLRDAPIEQADLLEYLKTQDDFALELYVYSLARSLRFSTSHGGTYDDPVTKKPRQYDVRAFMKSDRFRIDLVIECKSLKRSYPLLLLRIPRTAEESFHDLVFSHKSEERYIDPLAAPAATITLKGDRSVYQPLEYVAKSTAQVGRNLAGDLLSEDSEVYDKWSQALASAHDLIMSAAYYHRQHPEQIVFTWVLPVLVVSDETLWAADYSEDGTLIKSPHPVDEAYLYVGREYVERGHDTTTISHMHICTRSGVEALLREIADQKTLWESVFPTETIVRALKGAYP
jgi:hypothetical protein